MRDSRWPILVTVFLLSAALAGCAATSLPSRPGAALPDDAALRSGEALFGAPVLANELPDIEVRALDDEMRAFVARAVAGANSHDARLQRLLRAMLTSGLFSLDYQSEKTLTARETFHSGVGNCLAFTNLFVALAREARLQTIYRQVQVPATWTGDGETAILNQHVNALVRDNTVGRYPLRNHVVDFNLPDFRGNYPQFPISDERVDALFYNNLGAQAMRSGEDRTAFIYLVKALGNDDEVAGAWTNLGVLYQRNARLEHAESAFHRALRADPRHKPAMTNLSRLYEQRGMTALAENYRERVRRHQQRNPYYHFSLSEQAYGEGRSGDALAAIDQAIRLQKDEHRFHFMRAVILAQAGRHDASRESLERARKHASLAHQDIYDQKLRKLH